MLKLAAGRDVAGPHAYRIRDAAALAGRSQSWIRTMRDYGPLEGATLDGRQAVTSDSLLRLLTDRSRERAAAEARRNPFAGFPRLAFVNSGN